MVSDIYAKRGDALLIEAKARINSDIAQLASMQLFQHGELVAETFSDKAGNSMSLTHRTQVDGGSWFVLKASAKNNPNSENIVALSAPIYIYADGMGFCKPSVIPQLVSEIKERLKNLFSRDIDDDIWQKNKSLLQQRVDAANLKYDELMALVAVGDCNAHYKQDPQ